MISVRLVTNTERKSYSVDPDQKIKDFIAEKEVDTTTAGVQLDGGLLGPADMQKSFKDIGVEERCILSVVIKSDNK